jgi:NAD(P)-dependent dehydrogenase (short-subunit alcohol dehydrogenase family)
MGDHVPDGIDLPASGSIRPAFDRSCLAGSTILVTGSSSGLGRTTSVELSRSGARIILMGRDQCRLDQTLRLLEGDGHATCSAALVDADQTAELVRAMVSEHGMLHGVFHAAGSYLAMPARLTKQRHIDSLFAAAVWGAFGIGRAVAQKNIMHNGGSVVLMSSVAAERANPGTIGYASAKASVAAIVPVLALELAGRGIRVNAISAAATETEMHLKTVASVSDEVVRESRGRHMLGFGQPQDVAYAVTFLMSDASRWITGTTMYVDGGYMAK